MKQTLRRVLALLFLLALPLLSASAEQLQPDATIPPLRRILDVSLSARPSAMVVPGEVTLSFIIVNVSDQDALNGNADVVAKLTALNQFNTGVQDRTGGGQLGRVEPADSGCERPEQEQTNRNDRTQKRCLQDSAFPSGAFGRS